MITKKFKINDKVLILYGMINSFYYAYGSKLPKEIDLKIYNLLNYLDNYIDKDYSEDDEIVNSELYRFVTIKKRK